MKLPESCAVKSEIVRRKQVLNGDFFNKTDVVDFPAGNLGLEKSVKKDNKIEDKVAA